MKTDNLLLHCK